MGSSYKTLDLFGSGPHRFALDKQGLLVILDFNLNGYTSNTFWLGLYELDVIVTGRLVASSESALWTRRDAVTAQLIDPPMAGTLVDLHGRTWTDISFIKYEEGDRVDRGREHSVEYMATFRRFNVTP